ILANSSAELSRVATAIIAGHHEKWDVTSYPKGLSGDAIPIEARIVAVADVFEALCSDRPSIAIDSVRLPGEFHADPADR
ncbi:HD-GYP domain-containing protein, partial [Rhizobium ruizarguesonis]